MRTEIGGSDLTAVKVEAGVWFAACVGERIECPDQPGAFGFGHLRDNRGDLASPGHGDGVDDLPVVCGQLCDEFSARVGIGLAIDQPCHPSARTTTQGRCDRAQQACRAASSGTCSAKVLLPPSELSQNTRLTRNRIATSRPVIVVSDNRCP